MNAGYRQALKITNEIRAIKFEEVHANSDSSLNARAYRD
jgi:hypothetical protein